MADRVDKISNARRWTMLVCSLIAAMTTTCATAGVAYVIPELHRAQGMSLSSAAVLAAVPTIGLTLTIIAWGAALDRFGERRVLILSLLITLAGTVATLVAAANGAGFAVLAAGLLVGGLGAGAANGASGRIVVGWFPANQRGTAMGIRQMAQPLGVAVCAMTMPVLADRSGLTAAFAVPVAVTAIGLIAVVAGVIDPPIPRGPATARVGNPYRGTSFLQRVHGVSVLLVIPQSMLWTFVPAWLIVSHGWSPVSAGVLVTVTQVIGAVGRIVAGRVSDVVGSRMRPIRAIAAAAAAGTALLALTDWLGSPLAAAVMVLATVSSVADNGLAFTAIAEFAGSSWSGRALGVQNTAQYVATAACTPLLGGLIDAAGYPAAFAITALAPLAAIPLVPRDQSREAQETPV
ncbi:MFS transporter [Gordonia sp. (in: high G+C Gram-positive bacteria)]|uniref:MFS transporter n=1 Tax=Gordonia sp. (in: high G+C Gram-positive bacteria) TaxID=84139 RepID=UPI0016A84B55|nr:MFS transporter [Gordonia sp. (in: high G+C Gram-positive bacteria)]NLG46704.1 MFS transporter [Gordonia sp. (in: high G+C Gram-positive bacteria)]